MSLEFETKQPAEIITIPFNFTDRMDSETISTVSVTIKEYPSGTDAQTMFASESHTDNKIVKVRVQSGTDGKDYKITVKVTTNTGQIHELDGGLLVREQ